jgi:cardiolipin synthase (CMP-forming)
MASPFVKERFDQVRLINIANAVTAGRLLLVPVFAYMLISGRFRGAIAVFAACGASDLLDGLIARWLRQRTVVGFYLDPIADKMLMATSFVMLAYVGVVPTWLTVLVISRDVFIIVGSSLILLLVGAQEVRPTILSKANTLMQLLTVLYFLLIHAFPEGASQILGAIRPAAPGAVIVLCAATTALSGLQYLYIGMRKLSHA